MKGSKYVLLTGGTGFIGYAIVVELLNQGYTPILFIRKSSLTHQFDDIKDKLHLITVDFEDAHSIEQAFVDIARTYKSLRGIIYGLGVTKAKSRKLYYTVNCDYLKTFYQLLCESGISYGQFIFISSLTPHGPLSQLEGLIGVETPYNPVTYYAQSKLEAEKFIKRSIDSYTIIRPAAVYGKHDKEMLPLFKIVKKGVAVYFGSRKNRVGVIYADDLAVMIVKSLYIKEKNVVLGCTHNVTVYHYFNTISSHLNKTIWLSVCMPKSILVLLARVNEFWHKLLFKKMPMFNAMKVNELTGQNWACDNYTYVGQLGWQASSSFDKRIKETVEWYHKKGLL